MGKYKTEKKRQPQKSKWIYVGCLVIVLGLLALFAVPQMLFRLNNNDEPAFTTESATTQEESTSNIDDETTSAEENTTQNNETVSQAPPATALEFPISLAEGAIEIESLFQFSGVNPDAENRKATDVAAIVLRNTSGQYLTEATVSATLANGKEMTFVVREVPAGTSVMAFAIDNGGLQETDLCINITAKADFEDATNHDGIEVSVEGMSVTVTNTSSQDLNELDVYYRAVFSDRYFGGKAYIYNIEYLSAGESTTFTAEESLLGVIEVVRVAVNDKN